MKRTRAPAGLVAAILLTAPMGALPQPAKHSPDAQVIKLCFEDDDVRPWRTREKTGLNFDMLTSVASATSVRFEFHARPWRRCHEQLGKGEFDGSFAMSFTPERQSFAVYPPGQPPNPNLRMLDSGYVLVRRRGTPVSFDGERITGIRSPIGAEPGMSIVQDLRRQGYDVDDASPSTMALLAKLGAGRIDVAAVGSDQMHDLLLREGSRLGNLEVLPTPLVTKSYFLVFSRQFVAAHPQVAENIWTAIAEHRESPEYQQRLQSLSAPRAP